MAHSKYDLTIHGVPLRITPHQFSDHFEAYTYFINPKTTEPYTCKELSAFLLNLVEKDSLNQAAVEVWLGEIGPVPEDSKKVFMRYSNGATKEAAMQRAKEKCDTGKLYPLLQLLGQPVWKNSTRAGTITFRQYLDFLGDAFYASSTPRAALDMKAALTSHILPVIGDAQIGNTDDKWQKRVAGEIRKSYDNKVPDACRRALKTLFSSIRSNQGLLNGTVETLYAALKPSRVTPYALYHQADLAHLDNKQRTQMFKALYDMRCPRLLLIVSLIYCGFSPAEILAFDLDNVKKVRIRGELVYTYTVEQYYLSEGEKDRLVRVTDSKFSFPAMRRIVLSPLAAACMDRYKKWLIDHLYIGNYNRFACQLNHTPERCESLAALKKRLTDFLGLIGIKGRETPVQRADGKTEMQQRTVDEKLLLQDAKWVLTEICNANFAMCDDSFGLAAQTTDEQSYLDRFGDLYALSRYYQLARFSPFSPVLCQAQLDKNVLRSPVGFTTDSTWDLHNPTPIPQKVVVKSTFPGKLAIRM